jgi:diguanylate cyclase (GGDEF)-like protein
MVLGNVGTIADLEQGVKALCLGTDPSAFLNDKLFPDEWIPTVDGLQRLWVMLSELQSYSGNLTKGNLDVEPPLRANYLAAGLKNLHVQLNHLTWQAEQVAQGDYGQVVDFMGKFAQAFNTMTRQLQQREAKIASQYELMLQIFDHLDSLIIICRDVKEAPLFLNQTALTMLELNSREEIDFDMPPPLLALLTEFFPDTNYGIHEVYEPRTYCWYRILITPLEWLGGEMVCLYYCNDITEHKNLENMLAEAASTDALTGLLNRRGYAMAAEREWNNCMRHSCPVSLLVIDIDFFKNYNDTYGHAQGDQCLQALAACLMSNVNRMTDVIARVGGEEFVVMLPYADVNGGKLIADKLGKAVEQMTIPMRKSDLGEAVLAEGYEHITISLGVATAIPQPGAPEFTIDSLFLQADQALYVAKQSGRNQYRVYGDIPTPEK